MSFCEFSETHLKTLDFHLDIWYYSSVPTWYTNLRKRDKGMGEQERKIIDYVESQKTPEFQARQREMVAALNARAQQKPIRIQRRDVVLFITSDYQLGTQMQEGFLL